METTATTPGVRLFDGTGTTVFMSPDELNKEKERQRHRDIRAAKKLKDAAAAASAAALQKENAELKAELDFARRQCSALESKIV